MILPKGQRWRVMRSYVKEDGILHVDLNPDRKGAAPDIRPADEGWFSHDSGKFIPRTSAGKDTLLTKHGQGEGRVAYVDGEPVASVTWQETPDKILLGSAYTRPDQRGKGLFTALTKDLRSRGKPVDAVVWDNPWLRSKVASWQANAAGMSSPPGEMSSTLAHRAKTAPEVSSQPPHDISGGFEPSEGRRHGQGLGLRRR